MGKRAKPPPPGVPEWIVTYGDLMSLLLCFFILLAAFSELKKPDEYQKVIDAIQEAFGAEGGDSVIFDPAHPTSLEDIIAQGIEQRTNTKPSKSDTNDQTTVGEDQTTSTLFDGRRWTIGRALPFAPAEFGLTEDNKQIIRELIAPRIHGSDKMFLVLGHAWGADDKVDGMDPLELSYRRARAVHEFLVKECEVDPTALSLWVAGATQPLKLDGGAGAGGGNRRVEVFMTDTPLAEVNPDAAGTGRDG